MTNTTNTLFNAAVRSHLADPQGKWTLNSETGQILSAFTETSGVPYFVAVAALSEHCMDHYANAIAEVYRLSDGAFGETSLVEMTTRGGGRPYATGIRCKGALSALIEEYLSPYKARKAYPTAYEGFLAFAHRRLTEVPNLIDGYGDNLRGPLLTEIERNLSAAERDAIAREVADKREQSRKAHEEYLARESAEKAKREKRAAAAAARKATRVGVAEYRAMVQPRADRENA